MIPTSLEMGRKRDPDDAGSTADEPENAKPCITSRVPSKRLKGFEPSTFCMASRRSSQLSYSRKAGQYRGRPGGANS